MDRMEPQNGSRNSYWRSVYQSELVDVDKDIYLSDNKVIKNILSTRT